MAVYFVRLGHRMPRKRASQGRRERDKLIRSALRQAAAQRVQHWRVLFRPEGTVPVEDATEAKHTVESARSDPSSADSIEEDKTLQIEGREFEYARYRSRALLDRLVRQRPTDDLFHRFCAVPPL